MNEDSIEDLVAQLPDRLKARKAELEALLEGRLDAAARARLEAEAERDEDLADALMLFTPFDAAHLGAVHAKLQVALPTAPAAAGSLEVLPGGAEEAAEPAAKADAPKPKARGAWVVGGLLAAAAAVVLTLMPEPPRAPYRVEGPKTAALTPDARVRLELEALAADPGQTRVTVLAVAGESVHRAELPVSRAEGGRLALEAPAEDVVGPLAGVVRVVVLEQTETDPQGRVQAQDVHTLMDKLARFGAVTELIVQPPAYALAVAAEGTKRAAEDLAAATASTAVEVPGQVTLNLRPQVRTDGDLAAHVFVVRDGAAPAPLEVRVRQRRGAFLLEAPTARVMQDAERATLILLVGPEGQELPALDAPPSPPWRRVEHRLYRKPG